MHNFDVCNSLYIERGVPILIKAGAEYYIY